MESEKIADALTRLADLMEVRMDDTRLWTVKDIARYIKHHENMAYQLKDRPGFPRPVMVSTSPRWIPQEVKQYLATLRGRP